MTALAWPDADRIDRDRLERGLVTYCPICRRPSAAGRIDPGEALARLARHLVESHDPYFSAMLRVELDRASAPDPFYPEGAAW